MTDKTKQRARALQKKTGMSYQAALNSTSGPGRFEAILRGLIVLAHEWREKADEEFEELKAANPRKSVVDLMWKQLPRDFLRSSLMESPGEKALREYLEKLTYDEVINVITVMYCGRNREGFKGEKRNAYETFPTSERAIDQMTGKAPLAEYLRDGIAEVRRQGLDIENLPTV